MSHQQIDKPARDLRKPPTVHKVVQCLTHGRENWRVPSPGFTAKADKLVKQTVRQMKQPEKGVNQRGCGAANRATHPILPDNSIHMGIRILLIQDGAARNRVLGEAWTKVPRDLLKSNEDRIWWINWRAGVKQRGIKVKSQKKRWLEAKQGKPDDCRKPWSLRVSSLPWLVFMHYHEGSGQIPEATYCS